MKIRLGIFAGVLGAALLAGSSAANAGFIVSSSSEGELVTDTSTGLQYLSPYATRGLSINTIESGYNGLITTDGFSYASATTVLAMINTNFGNPPTAFPGTVAGFTEAQEFFAVFGITEELVCDDDGSSVACPRTQGFTLDGSSTGSEIGMIQFGAGGYLLDNPAPTSVLDSITDTQVGSWLVRRVYPVPEPSSLPLLLAGLGLIGGAVYFGRKKATTRI